MDETDSRFIGIIMFLVSIAIIACVQKPAGTVGGVILWIASLVWMAHPIPHREHTHAQYKRNITPLESTYHGNLVGPSRKKAKRTDGGAQVTAVDRAVAEPPAPPVEAPQAS